MNESKINNSKENEKGNFDKLRAVRPFVHATNAHWCLKVHEIMCNQTNKTSSKYTQLACCDIS